MRRLANTFEQDDHPCCEGRRNEAVRADREVPKPAGNSGKSVLLIAKHRRDEQGLDERIGFGRVVWGQDCGGFLCGRLRSLWRTPPAISYSFESLP